MSPCQSHTQIRKHGLIVGTCRCQAFRLAACTCIPTYHETAPGEQFLSSQENQTSKYKYTSVKIMALQDEGLKLIHKPFFFLSFCLYNLRLRVSEIENGSFNISVWNQEYKKPKNKTKNRIHMLLNDEKKEDPVTQNKTVVVQLQETRTSENSIAHEKKKEKKDQPTPLHSQTAQPIRNRGKNGKSKELD